MAHWTDDLTQGDIAYQGDPYGSDSFFEKVGNLLMGRGWVGDIEMSDFAEYASDQEDEEDEFDYVAWGMSQGDDESEGVNAGLGPSDACGEGASFDSDPTADVYEYDAGDWADEINNQYAGEAENEGDWSAVGERSDEEEDLAF
jgi:hypothetical protein